MSGNRTLAILSMVIANACAAPQTTTLNFKDMSPPNDQANALDFAVAVTNDASNQLNDLATSSNADLVTIVVGGPVLYPASQTLSPITPFIVHTMQTIAASATTREAVFAKAGDSNSVLDSYYMRCFDDGTLDLDTNTSLQSTIDFWHGGDAAGTSPYLRDSLATMVSKTALWAITGAPSPITQELVALSPRYATVMFGSNEIGSDSPTVAVEGTRAAAFGGNLLTLIETIIQAGTIPVLTAIPPRAPPSPAASGQMVPVFNALVRAVAQAKQIPFIDLERELRPLTSPKYGLVTTDGLHLQRPAAGACVFTSDGLQYGQNVRNLITMRMLDNLKAVMHDGAAAPDTAGSAMAPILAGSGDQSDPFVIKETTLPFGDQRNTATGGFSHLSTYTGCAATQDESGAEFWYRLDLTAPRTLRALVMDRGAVDIDVHLLDSTGMASGCLQRDDTQIVTAQLAAGTYYFVLDTFVKAGVAQSGEFTFVVLDEPTP